MGKFLRFLGILTLGMSSVLVILSGVGTSCVALEPTAYEGMEAIAQYQWLYVFYVLSFIALGIYGVRTTIRLVKGKAKAEQEALIMLVASTLIGILHMATSRALRGSSMPLDFIVYALIFTLALFLIFRLPGIREKVQFDRHGDNSSAAAGGMTAMVAGLLVLSVPMWAGPTHIFNGQNLAAAFHPFTLGSGLALFLLGLGTLTYAILRMAPLPTMQLEAESA